MFKKILALLFIVLFYLSSYAEDIDLIEVETVLEKHVFHPNSIDVPAGKKIRLIVKNNDDMIEEFESHDLKREKLVPSKSQIVVVIAPLEPGIYKFFGEFHAETAQGYLNVK